MSPAVVGKFMVTVQVLQRSTGRPTRWRASCAWPRLFHWYDRTDFILALAREGVDAFAVDMTSLRRELADG